MTRSPDTGAERDIAPADMLDSYSTWAATRAALAADRQHWQRRGCGPAHLRRGYHAIWLYRLSRYAHERSWRMAAWLLWLINGWWTGADIPPSSRIGGGCFLSHPNGAVIAGVVGQNVAFGLHASIGGLMKQCTCPWGKAAPSTDATGKSKPLL